MFAQAVSGLSSQNFGLVFLLVTVAAFYFLLIYPDNRRKKKLKAQIEALKPGTKVFTAGGIVGTVEFVNTHTLHIKSHEAKMEIAKEAIERILE